MIHHIVSWGIGAMVPGGWVLKTDQINEASSSSGQLFL